MEHTLEPCDEGKVLVLNGAITIEWAAEMRTVLLQAIEESPCHLDINFEKVTEVDLSCLQLLCSACKSCTKLDKQLTMVGNNPDVLLKLMQESGVCGSKCSQKQSNHCMWLGGA